MRPTWWLAAVVLATGLPTVGPAQAGEPVAEPVPPHLGACGPAPGAYQLPGTAACLRLSGFVAADIGGWRAPTTVFAGFPQPASPSSVAADIGRSAIGADARLGADVRIPTDYGPARIFVSMRGRHGLLSSAH